ncbi:MAG: hypothetical protein ABJC10_05325 [Acidobacteriota bacterium]
MTESQPKRLRYFIGRLLTIADFQLEQNYHRDKSKLHNRSLHGFGIVSGLKVSVDAGQIIVAPGLALDCEGNELVIPCTQSIALPATTAEWTSAYVSLSYSEEETDPIPAVPNEPSASSETAAEASTITESFRVAVAQENCNRGHRHLRARWLACGQPHPLTIAKLKHNSHGWRVERGYRAPVIK